MREDHPGLSWARNCGIMAARGEILAFTDDDVVVDAYWLTSLVRGFEVAEKVACVTGLILPLELETPAQFLFEAYGGFTRGFIRRIFDLKEHRPQLPLHPYIAGRFGTGASMAFTAAFLDSEGGFDPNSWYRDQDRWRRRSGRVLSRDHRRIPVWCTSLHPCSITSIAGTMLIYEKTNLLLRCRVHGLF